MANYTYIKLENPIRPPAFEKVLKKVVEGWFGDKLKVRKALWKDFGPVWEVYIPTSIHSVPEALFTQAEDFGFPVALQRRPQIAFRSAFNYFERWLQGCTAELLSEYFEIPTYSDATDEFTKPGVKRYRQRRKFGLWLARNFKKPLSPEDVKWVQTQIDLAVPSGVIDSVPGLKTLI
jgi:hypothetical protein